MGKDWAICGGLTLAVVLIFGQTLRYEFVNYDDNKYVTENPHVSGGLSPESVAWALTQRHANNWHPLTWMSHMLDCQIFGTWAGGHHAVNVVLHAAVAVGLFLTLRRMTGDLWPSALAAALLAVHPLRVESVAWVSERKDVLSGLFFVLTLAAYLRYARRPTATSAYLTVVVLFVLGLMAKPMLVTLPLVLLLLDYWPLGRIRGEESRGADAQVRSPNPPSTWIQVLLEKIPLLVISGLVCLTTVWAQQEALETVDYVPFSWRLGNAVVSYAAYLGQMVYPVGLAVLYPHPGLRLPLWQIAVSGALLTAISLSVFLVRRRCPFLLVGWLWYLVMLAPVIGLMQVGRQARADRYTYLPQIGLAIALAWGLDYAVRRRPVGRWIAVAAACLVLIVLAVIAWRQTSFWRNNETLWVHTLQCTRRNTVADFNLGSHWAEQGRVDLALGQFHKALDDDPKSTNALYGLGTLLAKQKKYAEAADYYRRVIQLVPGIAEVHGSLGIALQRQGRTDEAVAEYETALRLDPKDSQVQNNLASALNDLRRYEEAERHCREALRLRPDFAEAHNNLGIILEARGQINEAARCYARAVAIKPDLVAAHNNLGVILARHGRLDEAIDEFRETLRLDPQHPNAGKNLDNALRIRAQRKP
ncbi:MAG: tetratricopeptide repeat protein [Planctomycetaceae bacterium]|nr:tetratricopeptide repeat protein [Planctomycetaceae bacterium]